MLVFWDVWTSNVFGGWCSAFRFFFQLHENVMGFFFTLLHPHPTYECLRRETSCEKLLKQLTSTKLFYVYKCRIEA